MTRFRRKTPLPTSWNAREIDNRILVELLLASSGSVKVPLSDEVWSRWREGVVSSPFNPAGRQPRDDTFLAEEIDEDERHDHEDNVRE